MRARYKTVEPSDFRITDNLVHAAQGYWAFVPPPLEPDLTLEMGLVRRLSDADRGISELAGIARTLPNPHLLIGPFVRREAVLSSRIEGTQASLSDLLYFEAANVGEREVPDVREVSNYVRALEYGLDRVRDLPLSLRLIREMHQKLMEGVRGQSQAPGEFRRSQNWIGPPGSTLMNATYVPPHVIEMNRALDQFENYLNGPSELPPLIRIAMIHYQFEAIHPFLDGNGRIGRLLTTVLLCTENLLPQPLLYLSAFFERNRENYYRLLLGVSQKGDWGPWVSYFLEGVSYQARDAIDRSDDLLNLWKGYRAKLQGARASVLLLQLVDGLFSYPALTNRSASERLGVTPRSTQINIEKLQSAAILTEVTGQKRNRLYVAPEIIEIIERP